MSEVRQVEEASVDRSLEETIIFIFLEGIASEQGVDAEEGRSKDASLLHPILFESGSRMII